ncbi:MAG TPA: aldehyde dehydrogenase family protein [bacterium (Candidatus Stahlbacteria)]|nr:aldehyde dehydrogenase family protein [Candidatus Stahlbacteria bacterium]
METYRNFIGGEWVDSHSGEMRENINPATGEVLSLFPKSNATDIKDAIDAAFNAFDAWRLTPAPKRAEIIFKAAELLLERKERYAREMTQEMGKVINEARGDVQEAIDMTYYIAGEGRRLLGYTTPSELPNKFAMCVRMPIGVVAAITPWNFPMAIPVWKIMPALVAGNTVVIKPASYTPKSVYNVARTLEEAGLPKGVLNVVFGPGGELGDAILDDKRVSLVTFTGSTEVGTQIAEKGPKTYKRVSLEMGGKNAIIVLDDANIDLAVDGIIWSAFGTTGQRCTAASRVIVQKGILKQLTKKLIERTKTLKLGDGLNPDTDVGPLVSEAQLQTVDRYVQIGMQEAELLCGGTRAEESNLKKGFFYKPTIFGDVNPNATIAQEEIFGPVTAIIPVNSFEEAIEVNNGTDYGLSTSVYTRNVNRAFEAMRDIYTGLVYINAGTIGAEVHLPFGGTKGTGNGHREAGETALDECTEWKTIFVDYSGKLQKAQQIE